MDRVFSTKKKAQFEFDEEVASVFDDMLSRSIPLYNETLFFVANLLHELLPKEAIVVDLGCSTANTLLEIYKTDSSFKLFGYDNSTSMLARARKKVKAYGANITLEEADILTLDIPKADMVIANYMLQFIRPLKRVEFVEKIYNSLHDDGFFLFSEKVIYKDVKLHKITIDLYAKFKKNRGYSDFEIAQKREALENVLVPYTEEENIDMIKKAGFKNVETLLKWGNFATYLAKK